jgi:hypothetical protein
MRRSTAVWVASEPVSIGLLRLTIVRLIRPDRPA